MFSTFKCLTWVLFTLTLLLVSTVTSAASQAEPVKPELMMTGETTEDAELIFKWPDTSVVITGKEIVNALQLESGYLTFRRQIYSKASGLPVVDWHCRCEEDPEDHRIHASTELREKDMVIFISDGLTGKRFRKIVPITPKMASTAPAHTRFQLKGQTLVLIDKGQIDLRKVLAGGQWINADVIADGYQEALEWRCQRPPSSEKPRLPSCYCDGSDDEIDTPSCWNFRRIARVAFRESGNNTVEAHVFEVNFTSDPTGLWDNPRVFDLRAHSK